MATKVALPQLMVECALFPRDCGSSLALETHSFLAIFRGDANETRNWFHPGLLLTASCSLRGMSQTRPPRPVNTTLYALNLHQKNQNEWVAQQRPWVEKIQSTRWT